MKKVPIDKKLRALRKKTGQTIYRVAQDARISRESLTRLEEGRQTASSTSFWIVSRLVDYYPELKFEDWRESR